VVPHRHRHLERNPAALEHRGRPLHLDAHSHACLRERHGGLRGERERDSDVPGVDGPSAKVTSGSTSSPSPCLAEAGAARTAHPSPKPSASAQQTAKECGPTTRLRRQRQEQPGRHRWRYFSFACCPRSLASPGWLSAHILRGQGGPDQCGGPIRSRRDPKRASPRSGSTSGSTRACSNPGSRCSRASANWWKASSRFPRRAWRYARSQW